MALVIFDAVTILLYWDGNWKNKGVNRLRYKLKKLRHERVMMR